MANGEIGNGLAVAETKTAAGMFGSHRALPAAIGEAAPQAAVTPGTGSATPAEAAAPFEGLYDEKQPDHSMANTAIAGGLGLGLIGGTVAPTLLALARSGGQAAASAAQAGATTVQDQALGVLKGVAKPVTSLVGAITKGKSAKDNWGGEEKSYSWNAEEGVVERHKRSAATGDGNGFAMEEARDDAVGSARKGVQTVAKALKGTSGILDAFGIPVSSAADAMGVNPLASAGQILGGGEKVVGNVYEGVRHQLGKNAARSGQHAAEERGDLLHHGLRQAKVGHSIARNDAMRKGAVGGLEFATGGLGIAQFVDPTGGSAAAHTAVSATHKAARKGNLLYNAVQKGLRWDDVQEQRKAAEAGDAKAMQWMLANDPQTASAQLLMHAQTGSDESKAFAQHHIAKTLRLGDDGKRELATGSLGDFDSIYASRTGQDLNSQLDKKEAAVYRYVRPMVKPVRDMLATPGKHSDKKRVIDEDAVSEEYRNVTDFRLDRTYEELLDGAQQASLKKRYKGAKDKSAKEEITAFVKREEEATGELYNFDDHKGLDSGAMIDKLHDKTLKGAGRHKAKAMIGAGQKLPWLENKGLPEHIRAGLVEREDERREGKREVGVELPKGAPADGWKEQQKAAAERIEAGDEVTAAAKFAREQKWYKKAAAERKAATKAAAKKPVAKAEEAKSPLSQNPKLLPDALAAYAA